MSRQATRHFRGDRLRQLREDRGLVQDDLARRVGVRVRTVQRWEDPTGSEPSGHDVVQLGRELSCSPEYFYGPHDPDPVEAAA